MLIVVVVLLLSYLFSMGLGLYLLYFVPQGLEVASGRLAVIPLSLFMVVNFGIPVGVNNGLFFLVLWLLYALAFVLAWVDNPSLASSLKNFRAAGFGWMRSNYLTLVPQLSCVVLVAVILIQSLQESAGVQTGGLPPEPPVLLFLNVSYAPLVEELSYRITTIGFFNGLYLLLRRPRLPCLEPPPRAVRVFLLAIWKPEMAKQRVGLPMIQNSGVRRGISRFEWLLLAISSLAFGAVHYLAGGGWEIGKISTAALSGFAMGVVYLRYGAYAPILLHWFFNYYFGTYDLASTLGIAGFDIVSIGVQGLNLVVGALVVLVLIGITVARVRSRKPPYCVVKEHGESPNIS